MFEGTTILSVRHNGQIAMGFEGQVSFGNTIVKKKASKIRKLADGKVLAGFAGASADAFALFERFEAKLEEFRVNLPRAAVELAKLWRTDKYLRRLEAILAVADTEHSLLVSGTGEIVEPDDGALAIGSGAPYALAAARALVNHSSLNAEQIVRESIQIAASICVFTNDEIEVQTL